VITATRPDDTIIGEEGGEIIGCSEARGRLSSAEGEAGETVVLGERADRSLRWVVDPLDGTINYLFGIPMFAVSIACEDRDGALAAIVLDPIREEAFTATRSGHPLRNGQSILASDREELATALVATGFSYDARVRTRQAEVLTRLLPRVRDIRRAGAAALDLCWCACGRYDAYYERGLRAWDLAAGELLVRRAGLAVRELRAVGDDPAGVVVASETIIEELYELVMGGD
jgi:myo-inositol-1(or 4)-monophosphatase